jgi:hypothetical protein
MGERSIALKLIKGIWKTDLWRKVAINIFPVENPHKSNSLAIKIKTYSIVANPKPIGLVIAF